MRTTVVALVLAAAALFSACGQGMPLSPSEMSVSARAAGTREDAPVPDPAADPAPVPTPLMVSIIGSVGTYAYAPNPLTAVVGDMLVWVNEDVRMHHIVLDDGTDLGPILPGESSAPLTLAAESTGYSCLLHPSMVGAINRPLPVEDDGGDPYPYPDYGGRAVRDPLQRR
jgi:plastocyanin